MLDLLCLLHKSPSLRTSAGKSRTAWNPDVVNLRTVYVYGGLPETQKRDCTEAVLQDPLSDTIIHVNHARVLKYTDMQEQKVLFSVEEYKQP